MWLWPWRHIIILTFVLLEKNLIIKDYIISFDEKDIIAFITLNNSIYIYNSSLFDIDLIDIIYKPNIQSFRTKCYILQHIKTNQYIISEKLKND